MDKEMSKSAPGEAKDGAIKHKTNGETENTKTETAGKAQAAGARLAGHQTHALKGP